MEKRIDYIVLDSSFIARLNRIDKTCELLEYFKFFGESVECVIEKYQYSQSPCNHFDPSFRFLKEFITDEEVIENAILNQSLNQDLSKIYGDPVDVKIFIWALISNNVLVFACDKNLLKLCQEHNINHSCFKNAIMMLNNQLNDDIFKSDLIDSQLLDDGDDPFFHFNKNTRCQSHCGPAKICILIK